jgi:hypothetical protein
LSKYNTIVDLSANIKRKTSMRLFAIIILFSFTSFSLTAQKNLTGRYRDYFGSQIILYPDSTFKYTWHFDMQASWTKGIWKLKSNTVYFTMVPVYDTITKRTSNGITTDSLVLSLDETPDRFLPPTITPVDITTNKMPNLKIHQVNFEVLLSSGGQNKSFYLDKLIVRKKRLYTAIDGKPFTKKIKGFWSNKKWPTWYFKSDE